MIHIAFNPTLLEGEPKTKWEEMRADCLRATKEVVHNIQKDPNFDISSRKALWSELKRWLLANVFNNKCAYCECRITDSDYGHLDHYRPKGRVTVLQADRRVIVECQGRPHCGYYWIAYHWKNLLPACGKCNTGGKRDSFPVVAKEHIIAPESAENLDKLDELDPDRLDELEEPLLLHPYRGGEDDPRLHLRFLLNGRVVSKDDSPKGNASITTFGLNRTELEQARREAQDGATRWLMFEFGQAQPTKGLESFIDSFAQGKKPYSAAVTTALNSTLDIQEKRIKELKDELSGQAKR